MTALRLTPEQAAWIDRQVEAGCYGSAQEVVDEALRSLAAHEQWLNGEVRKGLRQLDQGEFSEAAVVEIFAEVIAEYERDHSAG